MIVKNEEKCLANALANLKAFDEIVILDTGSTDRTREIAAEYGCVVHNNGDPMHKGKSRNQVMELAAGDYCIVLDADETIQNPQAVKDEILKSQADIYYIRLSFMNQDNQPTLTYPQARIFKKGKAYYKYRAHEVPCWGPECKVSWTDLVWEHRPPGERAGRKLIYTLERLLLDVKENPTEPRPLFYLGRQYYYLQQYKAGVDTFDKYIQLSEKVSNADMADGYFYWAMCEYALNNHNRAIQILYRAIGLKPMHREYWVKLCEYYRKINQPDLAYACLRFVEKLPAPSWGYKHEHLYGSEFYDRLALCAYNANDFEPAVEAGKKAIEGNIKNGRLWENLHYYKSRAYPDHLKILFLTNNDWAGAGYHLMQAIRLYTKHEVRLVAMNPAPFGYPNDMVNPPDLDKWIEWADVVNVYDDYRFDIPCIKTYLGSYYRWRHEQEWRASPNAVKRLCTTPDLCLYNAEWLPPPMFPIKRTIPKSDQFLIVHAPSSRAKKGTDIVLDAMKGFDFDLVERTPYEDCLKRKMRAHVLIDQIGAASLGIGCNTLEAWDLGIPVISDVGRDDYKEELLKVFGELPFIQCHTADEIKSAVLELQNNPKFYQEYVEKGQRALEFYRPERVAKRFEGICFEVIGKR
jgi:glycosyltransferase involved in cell wall biosynthesis